MKYDLVLSVPTSRKESRFWVAVLPLLLIGILLSGCSRFPREWHAAMAEPIPEDSMAGPWEGLWVSEKSGHRGSLRAVIKPREDDRFRAFFNATYQEIFRFSYPVILDVEKVAGEYRFTGKADLGGWAGGVYKYDGEASPSHFFSEYESEGDEGYFILERPK